MASIIEKRRSLHGNLTEQLQQNEQLKSQLNTLQSLANIGSATCMIAHEINNLLTPLGNYALLALNNPDDTALVEKALKKTVKNSQHASKIMESIRAIANGQTQEKKNSSLCMLIDEVMTCLARDFSKDGITVQKVFPKELEVWAVPVQIQQVLMNLILNAREAMLPGGGVLTIRAEEISDAIRIELSDTGCGIEKTDLERIFEPFFTTKSADSSAAVPSGSGLGLAFCKRIIEEHDGIIDVESKPSMGTTFKITLPKNE